MKEETNGRIPAEEDAGKKDGRTAAGAAREDRATGSPGGAAAGEEGAPAAGSAEKKNGTGPTAGAGRRRRLSRSDRAREEMTALAAERAALADRCLRLQADFENFRKRVLREKDELYRRANEDIVLDLLPVMDHLDLAMDAAAAHEVPPAFMEGFRLVAEQLLTVLRKFGVERVDDSGAEFDARRHEAISHLPSDDVPADHIMARVRKGYLLGDRLLRPAQVVVSSGPAGGRRNGE